jgi:hypothetical protein
MRFCQKALDVTENRKRALMVRRQICRVPLECMRKKVFALSICAFKFTVSENENVYAKFTKAHHSSLISHFRFKIRALGEREI